MLKVLFGFLVILSLLILLCFLYLTLFKKCTKKETITIIGKNLVEVFEWIKKKYFIYILRKIVFQVKQDIRPFEDAVKKLNICKYVKGWYFMELSTDILELHFHIIGIADEYIKKLKYLSVLLNQVLQDFYIERLGNLRYPLVYITYIQEGEVVFWVAKNAYGNLLIQDRANADDRRDMPNTEELKND